MLSLFLTRKQALADIAAIFSRWSSSRLQSGCMCNLQVTGVKD